MSRKEGVVIVRKVSDILFFIAICGGVAIFGLVVGALAASISTGVWAIACILMFYFGFFVMGPLVAPLVNRIFGMQK